MADELPSLMLAAAGLAIPPDELAELCALYRDVRASLDRLYGPAFADADPYLVPTVATETTT
jgi:hypothetical protein